MKENYASGIFPVMGTKYRRRDYALVDLTRNNPALSDLPVDDLDELDIYLNAFRKKWDVSLLWGGYGESRYFYQASSHFEGRNIHLGIDIWAPAGTPVYAPMDGKIHSQAYNGHHRDYGATILLEHQIEGKSMISLYGHLSRKSLDLRMEGQLVLAGDLIAELGDPTENGGWIPHLHLQWLNGPIEIKGDFPGVCSKDEWPDFEKKCPNPSFLIFDRLDLL